MRNIRGVSILAVCCAALGLCACTSLSAEPVAHTVSPKPTKDGNGTVSQWASIVAEQKASLEAWKSDWDTNECSVAGTLLCELKTITGATVAQTVSISLASPQTRTATNYIGTPPSEIRGLYTDTRDAADAAATAGKAWSDNCSAGAAAGSDCGALLFQFNSASDALESKFQAWAPYI